MTRDLFANLVATGGPEQKTVVFCASDRHADDVAVAMNNLYASWCWQKGQPLAQPYAFKCTAASGGGDFLPDFRGSARHHIVATTVDLLTTGVDVPAVRNVVFFKYVRSPIAFYQMVGRGTRLDPISGKLMFRVYDYTDATRLFGKLDQYRFRPRGEPGEPPPGGEPPPPERILRVEGFDVHLTDAGRFILTMVDGRATPVTVEEYRERLAAALVAQIPTLEEFRRLWIEPRERRELMGSLPDGGRAPLLVRSLEDREGYDLFDVLADLAYGALPLARPERGNAFAYKNADWLRDLPRAAASTLRALVGQFVRSGTEGLESPLVFRMPAVQHAGGLKALDFMGGPAQVLHETKERLFAA
jgi:type I restriction enzyme R subunit